MCLQWGFRRQSTLWLETEASPYLGPRWSIPLKDSFKSKTSFQRIFMCAQAMSQHEVQPPSCTISANGLCFVTECVYTVWKTKSAPHPMSAVRPPHASELRTLQQRTQFRPRWCSVHVMWSWLVSVPRAGKWAFASSSHQENILRIKTTRRINCVKVTNS